MAPMEVNVENLEARLKSIKASDIMTRSVITTDKDVNLADLSKIMIEKRISGMPVLENGSGKIAGVVTKTDLFAVINMIRSGVVVEKGKTACCNPTVNFAMTHDVVTVNEDTTLSEMIDVMVSRSMHTLPVVSEGKMVGVVGAHDIFKSFYSAIWDMVHKG